MNSFDEKQVLENRLSDYQQSVLSVMGITQWYLRSVSVDDEQITKADDTENQHEVSVPSTLEQQEKKAASVSALRGVLSTGSDKTKSVESVESVSSAQAGLNPTFPIVPHEQPFVDAVISSVAGDIQIPIEWSITGSFSLSGNKLETPAVEALMTNPSAKKQLWHLLKTLL
jgi:DNA polymerase III psi subunit